MSKSFLRGLVIGQVAHFESIKQVLKGLSLILESTDDFNEALGFFGERPYSLVISEGGNENELRSLLSLTHARVILVGTNVTPAQATHAVRLGAYDYVSFGEALRQSVQSLLDAEHPEVQRPRWLETERAVLNRIVCRSPEMQHVVERVRMLAQTPNTTGLILGETGSGKELIASAIHFLSARAQQPFIAVDCSAIPESLFESELFGHERGSFSGATHQRKGRFELAHGGTLFLDEIGELPLTLQSKVLRALEEREIWRVGATAPRPIDVRVVAATHRNLTEWVGDGRFRPDLFYRLSVFTLELPALRARATDILHLADFFVRRFCAEQDKPVARLTAAASAKLISHDFPGNVRELRNILEQAVVSSRGELIDADAITLPREKKTVPAPPEQADAAAPAYALSLVFGEGALDSLERQATEIALRVAKDNRTVAARLLGVSRVRISRTIERFGLSSAARKGRPEIE